MKLTLRLVHKYISLTLAALWLLQALTGVLLVFQRDIDHATLPEPTQGFNPVVFSHAVARIQAENPDAKIPYIYATGVSGRFDVFLTNSQGQTNLLRLDGDGRVLRERPYNYDFWNTGIFRIAIQFHETLFSGDRGQWVIGLSAVFLLTNLVLGIKLAWPHRGQWRRVLWPRSQNKSRSSSTQASVYAWHRAVGLWFAIPAMASVVTGLLMAWPFLTSWVGPTAPAPTIPTVTASSDQQISLQDALEVALTEYPGAQLSILGFPRDGAPIYRIRLLQGGEIRRVFGTTELYIDARDGAVLANYNALEAPLTTRVLNSFYPIHSGEALGLPGRIVVFLSGLWLISMIGLGLSLWWLKRRPRKRLAAESAQ